MNLTDFGRETAKDGFLARIDARIKVILSFLFIVAIVFFGRNEALPFESRILFFAILEAGIIAMLLFSRVRIRMFAVSLAIVVLAFGGSLALFRPFLDPGAVVAELPFGIDVTREGLNAAALLLGMFIVSVSTVLLMSLTTTVSDMVAGLRKLGLPASAAALLGMTLRYLFLYFENYSRIRQAQVARGFRLRNRRVSYAWKLRQVGNTIGTLFIGSVQQGQRVYEAMASRCYSHVQMSRSGRKLQRSDVVFFMAGVVWLIGAYAAAFIVLV